MTKPKDSTTPSSATNDKKVFDVSHPGKAAPSSTSRPVIVTNRPILRDPMMVEPDASTETGAPEEPSLSATRIKITPPSEQGEPKEATANTDSTAVTAEAEVKPSDVEPAADTNPLAAEPAETLVEETSKTKPAEAPATSQPEAAQPEPESPGEPASTPETPEEASSDPDDEPADTDTPKQKADAEAEAQAQKDAARQAELDKLIESQKYFLPINAVQKRRTVRTAAIIVIVLLVVAAIAVDLALDAGLIHIDGVKPFTNFFTGSY